MQTAVRIEHVSKEYRLGSINHGMLYKDLQSWMARRLGKPDPHAVIGSERNKSQSDRFWALKDVSFEIEKGDRVGIIGRNGAGKSTLLKILSRITAPTEGFIGIRGRVSSLLEVGTGFHPELTGRENVYLNGAILGMKRREIDRKFDEIVAFSEIEGFIDTPVKRYSSGMYVRLAFAVAAHLESEILIADEVLAVGDTAFQKKCLGKMEDVSRNQGRTILFVSHNLPSVKKLCNRGIILQQGAVTANDAIEKIIKSYMGMGLMTQTERVWDRGYGPKNNGMEILGVTVSGMEDLNNGLFHLSHEVLIDIDYSIFAQGVNAQFSLSIMNKEGIEVGSTLNNQEPNYYGEPQVPGLYRATCRIYAHLLNDDDYSIILTAFSGNWLDYVRIEDVVSFKMVDDAVLKGDFAGNFGGVIRPAFSWNTKIL
jgi:lipopolysaccharide transport system ATP-binding protein